MLQKLIFMVVAIVAAVGAWPSSVDARKHTCTADKPWRAQFSGRQYDFMDNSFRSFVRQGCFKTEVECRRFLDRSWGALGGGPTIVSSCSNTLEDR